MDVVSKMKVFIRVVELQSFTKAADALNLPKASVSTSIRDLESFVGARLLNRTTRQVQVTAEGQRYFERCQEIVSDVDETASMFRSRPEQMKGKIRIDMAASMATHTFLPLLPNFSEKYPGLEIELSCSDQTVDLVRDGIDCLLRAGSVSQPGTIERVLGQAKMVNCVSPDYIKKYGRPKNVEDLKNHRLVHYTQTLGGRSWGFEYHDGKVYREVKMRAGLTVNNTDAYRAACLAGFGIIQAPRHGIANYLKSGELVEVLPKLSAEPLAIKLVYVERRLMADRVRVFMNWLEPEIRHILN